MGYTFLHTVQTMAKRFNDRMTKIVKELGADSPIVERFKTKLDVLFPDNYAMKGSVPKIINPAQIYNDEQMNDDFYNLMQDVPTWTDIKQTYKADYDEYISKFESKDAPTFPQFIADMESIPQLLTWVYNVDTDDTKKALEIMRKKEKSYKDLHDFIDKVKIAEMKQKNKKGIKKVGAVSELLDKFSKVRGKL